MIYKVVKLALCLTLAGSVTPLPFFQASAQTTKALSAQDYSEIQKLYADYAFALDTGDGAARTATFTSDGTFSSNLSGHKPESAQAIGERTTRQGNTGARHLMMNIDVWATPEGAEGHCHVLIASTLPAAAGSNPNSGGLRGVTGFYFDKLVRTPQGWRFKTRVIWLDSEPDSPYRGKHHDS